MTSAILTKLAETYPQVLKKPESILGPNYPKVLEFWEHIEGLNDQEREEVWQRYLALDGNARVSACVANNAAEEVVGWKFSTEAWWAAWDTTGWRGFGWATVELIGNVDNKVAYDLIMSHKKP